MHIDTGSYQGQGDKGVDQRGGIGGGGGGEESARFESLLVSSLLVRVCHVGVADVFLTCFLFCLGLCVSYRCF